jgi:hypothetical protein
MSPLGQRITSTIGSFGLVANCMGKSGFDHLSLM